MSPTLRIAPDSSFAPISELRPALEPVPEGEGVSVEAITLLLASGPYFWQTAAIAGRTLSARDVSVSKYYARLADKFDITRNRRLGLTYP